MEPDAHVIDELAAYALGILADDEALQVERHLLVCESCRQDLRGHQRIVDLIPLAAPVVEPPAGLKASILAEATASSAGVPKAAAHSRQPERSGWFGQRMPAWGVASLALILLLALANLLLWNQLREVTGALESSLQVVTLSATDLEPGAAGLMVVGGNGRVGALIVDNLPPLDEEYAYQLWLIGEAGRENGGVFSVSEEGYGVEYIYSDHPLLSYKGFGITIEPAGGSEEPTGDKVLGIDF